MRAVLGERYSISDGWYFDPAHDYTQPLPESRPAGERAGFGEPGILVDRRVDKKLANILNHVEHLVIRFPTTDSKARLLSMIVSSFMGGSDPIDHGRSKKKEAQEFLSHYRLQHPNVQLIPLGSITIGGELHRGLLFKYLCSNLDPQLPCKLVIRNSTAAAVFMPVPHHPGTYQQVDLFSPGHLINQRPSSEMLVDLHDGSNALFPKLAALRVSSSEALPIPPSSKLSRASPALVSQPPPPAAELAVDDAEWHRDSSLEHDYRRLLNIPDLQLASLLMLEPLGSGSFGSVYRCSLGPLQLAVKRVSKAMSDADGNDVAKKTAGLVRSLINEASLLVGLNHPNVVRCLGYEDTQLEFRVFFELLGSGSFWSFMHYRKSARSPFKDDELLYYSHQVVAGLLFLHEKGISHRDIKSANIVLDGNTQTDRYYSSVKLCDFGFSVRRRPFEESSNARVGTEQYSAPEVLLRIADAEPSQSDIWSFAMFIIELLTLDAPYATDPKPERIKMITSRTLPSNLTSHPLLAPLIDRCTQLNPAERPTSRQVIVELEKKLLNYPTALSYLTARNRLSWQNL
jgi:hypothetical protein